MSGVRNKAVLRVSKLWPEDRGWGFVDVELLDIFVPWHVDVAHHSEASFHFERHCF